MMMLNLQKNEASPNMKATNQEDNGEHTANYQHPNSVSDNFLLMEGVN